MSFYVTERLCLMYGSAFGCQAEISYFLAKLGPELISGTLAG
jgi:hypothetical protein